MKQGAKGHPVVERSAQRVGMLFMVPKWGLFGYHRNHVWESSGECRTEDGRVEGSWHNPRFLKTEAYSGTYEFRDGKFCSNDWCYRLRVAEDGSYELVDSSQDFGAVQVLEGRHSFVE